MKTPRLREVTPLVPVADAAASLQFFETAPGFEAQLQSADYACLRKHGAALRLQAAGQAGEIAGHTGGVDARAREWQPQRARPPKRRVCAPFDRPYGMREFHVTAPGNLLIFFGEPPAAHDPATS